MEMEGTPKGIYTPEFRAEAVKRVETTGMSVARAAKQLSLPKSSLDNWVRAAREGKLAEVGKGQRLPSELELELARTRKELAEVKRERDLLKKFATYFAQESR
jgi:transposase